MKKVIFTLFLATFTILSVREASYAQNRKPQRTKQFIVTFKSKPKASELLNLSRNRKKSRLKYSITESKSIVFEPTIEDADAALEELKADPSVETVARDGTLQLLYVPNDPGIKGTPAPGKPRMQWDMYNLNLAGSGRTAWDISKGSPSIVVAVLDSGVDSSHDDLAGKFISLVDCSTGTCQTVSSMTASPTNLDESHGTHVAGIIGAATDNNRGVAGSGFNTSMMMIRLRNAAGEMQISSFINGIRYAADHNADIINMSLGAIVGNLDEPIIQQINDAVLYAWNKNVLLVAAAGNCGWDATHHKTSGDPCDIYNSAGNYLRHSVNEKYFPAASPNVLSVAALDINNQLAPYSEYNDPGNSQIGNWISISAPGGMFTTDADKENGIANTWPGSSYFYSLGTSSAAPHVSGIAALILAKQPTLTNIQLKTIIENTANAGIIPGKTRFGMINAVAALDSLAGTIPSLTPIKTPTRTPTPPAGGSPTPPINLSPTRTPTPTPPVSSPTKIKTPTPTSPTGASPTIVSEPSPTIEATITQTQPTDTPAPSPTIALDIPPEECLNNPNSASCFLVWFYEYTRSILSIFTDYNSDGIVDLKDFEIWRRTNL